MFLRITSYLLTINLCIQLQLFNQSKYIYFRFLHMSRYVKSVKNTLDFDFCVRNICRFIIDMLI